MPIIHIPLSNHSRRPGVIEDAAGIHHRADMAERLALRFHQRVCLQNPAHDFGGRFAPASRLPAIIVEARRFKAYHNLDRAQSLADLFGTGQKIQFDRRAGFAERCAV
ncbi:MAG: hypothetical protein MUF81_05250 [Verrucomicrobia bacterium]|nr:hypothetical protein [Verrucomicrobiota bacterium]